MKRPQTPGLTRENYREVYQRCCDNTPKKRFMRFGYAACDGVLRTKIEFVPGAEDDLKRINEDGLPHIYAFNHLTNDHFVVGSILHRIAPQDVGSVRVLGNDVTLNQRGVRMLAKAAGAIPVARRVDHEDPEFVELCKAELIDCSEYVMNNGYKISIHPEGDTNKVDPLVMARIKQGTALIALRTAPSAITPIGYTYGPGNLDKPERDRVIAYVQPSIFVTSGDGVEQLTDRLARDLQDAVSQSSEHWHELFQPNSR